MNQQKPHKQVCGWLNTMNEQGLGRVPNEGTCGFEAITRQKNASGHGDLSHGRCLRTSEEVRT